MKKLLPLLLLFVALSADAPVRAEYYPWPKVEGIPWSRVPEYKANGCRKEALAYKGGSFFVNGDPEDDGAKFRKWAAENLYIDAVILWVELEDAHKKYAHLIYRGATAAEWDEYLKYKARAEASLKLAEEKLASGAEAYAEAEKNFALGEECHAADDFYLAWAYYEIAADNYFNARVRYKASIDASGDFFAAANAAIGFLWHYSGK